MTVFEGVEKISKKYPLIIISVLVLIQALTVVFIKKAALTTGDSSSIFNIIFNVFYLLAFSMFFVRAILWQIVLIKNPVSKYYPILSLNYIFILLFGYFFFKETISLVNILGSIVIVFGIFQICGE